MAPKYTRYGRWFVGEGHQNAVTPSTYDLTPTNHDRTHEAALAKKGLRTLRHSLQV